MLVDWFLVCVVMYLVVCWLCFGFACICCVVVIVSCFDASDSVCFVGVLDLFCGLDFI